jgi:hypothetical protein
VRGGRPSGAPIGRRWSPNTNSKKAISKSGGSGEIDRSFEPKQYRTGRCLYPRKYPPVYGQVCGGGGWRRKAEPRVLIWKGGEVGGGGDLQYWPWQSCACAAARRDSLFRRRPCGCACAVLRRSTQGSGRAARVSITP